MKKIESENSEETIQFNTKFKKWNDIKAVICKYCGESHAKEQSACPAYRKHCTRCYKINHFAKACKQPAKKPYKHQDKKPRSKFYRRQVHLILG